MAIDTVYEHEDGYRFNIIYSTKKKFLTSVNRQRNAVFLHAIDNEKLVIIYPSTINDYRHS